MSENGRALKILSLAVALVAVAGMASAASDLWLHVSVDEEGGAKVRVNLPVALMERAIPMIPTEHLRGHHVHFDEVEMEIADLKALWEEISQGPDMTYVTVEDADEDVRVWKQDGFLRVEVRQDGDDERVDVKVPASVVDVLLSGESGELNLRGAMEELVARGGGDLVTVKDGGDNVRVWIDDVAEGRAP